VKKVRKVEIKGWLIFDEEELQHKTNIVGQIDHELFNVEGMREWCLEEVSNKEIEYEDDEDWN
jgi:hypothetical protein